MTRDQAVRIVNLWAVVFLMYGCILVLLYLVSR
jgi:hypothetical protein